MIASQDHKRGFEVRPAENGGTVIIGDRHGLHGQIAEVLGAFTTPADMISWLAARYEVPLIPALSIEQTEGKSVLNHDLLERALTQLTHEAISAVETSCQLVSDGFFETVPVPETCPSECVEHIETLLDLIRDIESEIGPSERPEPDWFADLVDRRWPLTGVASAPITKGNADE